ncbi:MAG: fluoride efflux transporter CrcB [Mucilaginibacter sp.]
MRTLLLVFIGGGLGSVMRYAVNRLMNSLVSSAFPIGTFLVNIIGCFFIGFLVFYTNRFGSYNQQWRLFLVVGLCGGFTTFSAFSYENVALINDHRIFLFLAYTIGSVALGIIATYCGLLVARNI